MTELYVVFYILVHKSLHERDTLTQGNQRALGIEILEVRIQSWPL